MSRLIAEKQKIAGGIEERKQAAASEVERGTRHFRQLAVKRTDAETPD
jgi:hypothetical protein